MTTRSKTSPWWLATLAAITLGALALDLGGHAGILAFNVPCTMLALLLLLAQAMRMGRAPAVDATAAPVPTDVASSAAPRMAGLWATTDAHGHCTALGEDVARWLDVEAECLLGQPADQLFGPLNRDKVRAALLAAMQGTPQQLRLPCSCQGGTERWLQLALAALPAAPGLPVAGCSLLAADVTELQGALESARNGERRLRIIMDQIPVTVSYIDADLRYRYINRAQSRWLGKDEHEVVERPVRDVVGDAVFADIAPRLRQALAGKEIPLERQRTDRHGNPVWHSGRHVPDVDDQGQAVGVYTVFFDVSQRAQAEQRLRQREQELLQREVS